MRIQHNIPAMNAYRNYNNNTSKLSKNLEKLSSGYKINRAGDDAAGLAISEKMRAQITGLSAAQKNVKDGVSLVKTAEGAMQEIHDMLNRMDYLATQSANGTYDNEVDRLNLQKEVDSLKSEINRIADSANFNGIKLLDGSLSSTTMAAAIEGKDGEYFASGSVEVVENMTVETGENGTGTKGKYSAAVTKPFGADDAIEITFAQGQGGNPVSLPTNDLTAGKLTLKYGVDFTGTTAEEQAASIAEALKGKGDVAANFDVKAVGNRIELTNKNEGNDELRVTNFAAVHKDGTTTMKQAAIVTGGADVTATGADVGTASADKTIGTNVLKDQGLNLQEGDKLILEVEDQNGKTWKATLEIDATIAADGTNKTLLDNLKTQLGATGTKFKFEDVDGTVVDESNYKVQDFFTFDTTTDALKVKANDNGKGGEMFGGKTLKLSVEGKDGDTTSNRVTQMNTALGTGVTLDAGKKGTNFLKTGFKLDTTNGDSNFSNGDEITVGGKLSDGSTFEVKLTAGTDFEVGTDANATLANIKAALEGVDGKGLKATVTDATSGEKREVNSGDIFGATKEMTINLDTANKGIEFQTNVKYAGNGTPAKYAQVTANTGFAVSKAADAGAVVGNPPADGLAKGSASSSITFGKDGNPVLENDTVKVKNGNSEVTYEFVTDVANLKDANNKAIVVNSLTDNNELANALKAAVEADFAGQLTATDEGGGKLTLTTVAKGSDVEAPTLEVKGGNKYETLSFTLDPKKVGENSKVTIDGKTYEFVKDADKAGKDSTAVVVEDLDKADAKALADALKKAIGDDAKFREVSVDDKGKITLTSSAAMTGEVYTMKKMVSFSDSKNGLTLQIGDTADSFNQMKVSVGDMHTTGMGIDGVNISNQDDAAAAIDMIKSAINYVSGVRGDLGAIQNRLEHTGNNLSVMAENIQDAESTIRDTDVAEEMMSYVKNNILVQSAQAMLAQANQLPQGVLQLLG